GRGLDVTHGPAQDTRGYGRMRTRRGRPASVTVGAALPSSKLPSMEVLIMRRTVSYLALAIMLVSSGTAFAKGDEKAEGAKKLGEATEVYHELISASDKEVPKELLENCKCIAVLPGVIKAAVGYGGRHGTGVMTCRTSSGWSAPAFVKITGGSF